MTWEYNNYLAHHGILGQKWGVRRFQNEDGTLTEEGKRRYYDTYDKMEKDADAAIAGAKHQIEDIDKNGWGAKSAFSFGFIDDLKRNGNLTDENLKFFRGVFEQDLAKATLSKKTAQQAKSFIEKNDKILVDDIYDNLIEKVDKDDRTGLRKETLQVSKEMGVETKVDYKMNVKSTPSKSELESFKSKVAKSDNELNRNLADAKKKFQKYYGINTNKMAVNGKLLSSMSPEEQYYYLMVFAIQLGNS